MPEIPQHQSTHTRRELLRDAVTGVATVLVLNATTTQFSAPNILNLGRTQEPDFTREFEVIAEAHDRHRAEVARYTGKTHEQAWRDFYNRQPVNNPELMAQLMKDSTSPLREFRIDDLAMRVLTGSRQAMAAGDMITSQPAWTNGAYFYPLLMDFENVYVVVHGGNQINLQAENGPLGKYDQVYQWVTGEKSNALQSARDLSTRENAWAADKNYSKAAIESMGRCHAKGASGLLEQPPTPEVTRIIDATGEWVDITPDDREALQTDAHNGDWAYLPLTQDEIAAGALDLDEDGNYVNPVPNKVILDRLMEAFLTSDPENNPGGRFVFNAPDPGAVGRWFRAAYGVSSDKTRILATSFGTSPVIITRNAVVSAHIPVPPDQGVILPEYMQPKLSYIVSGWENKSLKNGPKSQFRDVLLELLYDPERLVVRAQKKDRSIRVESVG